jgi:hypothetical protein
MLVFGCSNAKNSYEDFKIKRDAERAAAAAKQ